jgi:thiamine pyrophosphokinase
LVLHPKDGNKNENDCEKALRRIFRHKREKVTVMGEWDQNGSFGD